MKKPNEVVLKFINKIAWFPDREGNSGQQIDHLFCSGYCYYFANILKIAFGGTICWVEDMSHIVWLDGSDLENDIAYDITGVYYDYKKLRPIDYLGDVIIGFKHNDEIFHMGYDFSDFCDFCKIDELYAVEYIWSLIPYSDLEEYDSNGLNMIEAVYQYWMKNSQKIKDLLRSKIKPYKLHEGV